MRRRHCRRICCSRGICSASNTTGSIRSKTRRKSRALPASDTTARAHSDVAAAVPDFDDGFRARLHELFAWRRDVRRFKPDALPDGTLERLIELACLAPSVGLSQPWRFVVVDEPARRRAVLDNFERCNADAL